MKRAVHRAGFRPLAMGSTRLLLRPAALKIAAFILFILLTLGLYSLSRGSFPLPSSTWARALLAPEQIGEQQRFILFDIRLPRICLAWRGRRCRALPVTVWRTPALLASKREPALWYWR